MKETLAEYARLVIVVLSLGLMIGFIFNGTWLHRIGHASNAIENNVVQVRQDELFDNLANRKPPEIHVFGLTAHVGEIIHLHSDKVIPENYNGGYPIQDSDGNNLFGFVKIKCDSSDYNPDKKELIPSKTGVYKVTYTVKDSYGLSASKTINITVN